MPSHYFRIEVYGHSNFGCPEFDLMGYNDIEELEEDCWEAYIKENADDILGSPSTRRSS